MLPELTNKELINLLTALAQLIEANNKSTLGLEARKENVINTANWIAEKVLDKFRLI